MKNSIRILILGSALLTACTTNQQKLQNGLHALHGRHLEAAVQRLGVPVGEENVAGMRVVVWSLNETRTDYVTQTTRASAGIMGTDKFKDFDAEFSVDKPVIVHAHCTIRLRVGADNVITGSNYDGDIRTCRRYIRALNPDDPLLKLQSP